MRAIDINCPTCSAEAGRMCNPIWNHDNREALADNATRDEPPAFTGTIDELEDYLNAPTDLEPRLALLRAASRPDEPLTDRNGPTAQGNIISAITKLERERALVMTRKKL